MNKNSLYDTEYYKKIEQEERIKKERRQRRSLLIAIAIVLFAIYLLSPLSKINSIKISGNDRYDDVKIKEIANLDVNQFTFIKPAFLIDRALEKTNLFEKVEVTKSTFGDVDIIVKENRLLFYTEEDKKIVFYDQKGNRLTFDKNVESRFKGIVPELIVNKNLSQEIKDKLIDKLQQLDSSVLNEISQIKYEPTTYDKEFFNFIMTGKKEIYIETSLDNLVKVGSRYHSFSVNTTYKCSVIQFIDSENKAIVRKCD